MPELIRISESEAQTRIALLPGWEVQDNGLRREFGFANFVDAFSFMTSVAFIAERMAHHPEWSNGYNAVTIRLSTHDVSGISENDFMMAAEISDVYGRFEPR